MRLCVCVCVCACACACVCVCVYVRVSFRRNGVVSRSKMLLACTHEHMNTSMHTSDFRHFSLFRVELLKQTYSLIVSY